MRAIQHVIIIITGHAPCIVNRHCLQSVPTLGTVFLGFFQLVWKDGLGFNGNSKSAEGYLRYEVNVEEPVCSGSVRSVRVGREVDV